MPRPNPRSTPLATNSSPRNTSFLYMGCGLLLGGGLVPLYFTTFSFPHSSAYCLPASPGRLWAPPGVRSPVTSVWLVSRTVWGPQWMLSVEGANVRHGDATHTGWECLGAQSLQISPGEYPFLPFGSARNCSSGLSPLVIYLSKPINSITL